ncbi:MAG: hypothetical protein LUP95_02045 [Euryarchaeota archaeon]|nr:hypothetical protein [Euryarchaeota archaeon]
MDQTSIEASTVDSVMSRLGFWSAIMTAVIAAVFFLAGILTPPRSGPFAPPADTIPYPYTNVAAFIPNDYLWLYPGILLAPIFIVLMACIHAYARNDRKVFSQIALSFSVIYATIILIDYFIQFTVVIPSILTGETAGLSLFTQYNPHGIFIAFEALGYSMMSIAFLFTGAVFAGGKLERALRWIFIAGFVVAVLFFAALSVLQYDLVAFEVTILTINWIVLIVSGVLLSVVFRRAARGRSVPARAV